MRPLRIFMLTIFPNLSLRSERLWHGNYSITAMHIWISLDSVDSY